jgi:hypothetical protein
VSRPSPPARARWVSGEVLDLTLAGARGGSVIARFGSTVHAQLGDFVVAVLPPAAARLPNGLSIPALPPGAPEPRVGDRALLSPGRLLVGGLEIGWDRDRSPRWNPTVRRWSPAHRERLDARARAILAGGPAEERADGAGALAASSGFAPGDAGARDGVAALLAAVRHRDARLAAHAARQLVGRGAGLTPLGDDLLAATALTVGSLGEASGFPPGRHRAWLDALVPPELRKRTTAVSATLLELATRGSGIGPAQRLLDPDRGRGGQLGPELDRLRRLGHTTGPAYATAIGIVARELATPPAFPATRPRS